MSDGFVYEARARFHQTDAMGVVHHASYLAYLEDARVEYLRALGHPYERIRREDGLDFAVVEVQLAYLAPLRFDDAFRVHVRTAETGRASFALEYAIERDGATVARGRTRHAVIAQATGRPARAPAWLSSAT